MFSGGRENVHWEQIGLPNAAFCVYVSHLVCTDNESCTLRSKTILTNESPLKMMKNALCLMLKALFVLEIFTFLH